MKTQYTQEFLIDQFVKASILDYPTKYQLGCKYAIYLSTCTIKQLEHKFIFIEKNCTDDNDTVCVISIEDNYSESVMYLLPDNEIQTSISEDEFSRLYGIFLNNI